MKKKLLFMCSNLNIGGFQKSLISLLNCFDYDKYDIDLLLLNPKGVFTKYIDNRVNILPPIIDPEYYDNGAKAVWIMIKKKKLFKALIRFISCLLWVIDKSLGAAFMIKGIPELKEQYDVAIDYNGQHLLYYLVDKVNAEKRISYFHSDYKKWNYYQRNDKKYYNRVDAIVTVSDECVASMKEIFPECANKIWKIENIISANTVVVDKNCKRFDDKFFGVRIITVGRVCMDKGIDFAVEACRILSQKGYLFKWYWVGPLQDGLEYLDNIKKYSLEDFFILLGPTDNPYGYMQDADILAQPSRYEGKSVTVEEAKVMHIPVVATCYSTVRNQIEDGKTGFIVDMNAQSLAEGLEKLIVSPSLRQQISKTQSEMCLGNEDEVQNLYRLIEM